MSIKLCLTVAALGLAAPAIAQTAPQPNLYAKGYANQGGPNDAAVNAKEAPVTAALNGQVAAQTGAAQADQAQYDADRQAYMAALVQHDAAVNRTDARYARQQRAYADAMAVWRVQVTECKKGHQRACDMPPPSPADYY